MLVISNQNETELIQVPQTLSLISHGIAANYLGQVPASDRLQNEAGGLLGTCKAKARSAGHRANLKTFQTEKVQDQGRGCPVLGSGFHSSLQEFARGKPFHSLVILSAVTGSSVMDLFLKTGAYLKGHFRLTSGLHSGEYLQCAKVLAYPEYAEMLGSQLAAALAPKLNGGVADVVVSPAIGGIVIGHEVARALHCRSLFTERDPSTREMTLRRGFEVKPGERAVVVEDVITTGGSTKEVVELLRGMGADVLAAGSIIDRSGNTAEVGVARVALETLQPETFQPDECPLCREGIPVTKPGSRPT